MDAWWVCLIRVIDAEAKVWVAKENAYRENKTEINSDTMRYKTKGL